jgi:ribose/xylose/arabinose/galactoside ABC-type transport system permease subunit
MTYIPPERDESALDQTRQLEFTPPPLAAPGAGLPATGDGGPVDPFAGQAPEAVAYAEPAAPRDRVVFQFIWEAILLLLTLNALFLVYRRRDALFGDEFDGLADALSRHALHLTPILLAALAIGLSLRLGAVNLAAPALAFVITVARPFEANVWIYMGYVAGAAAVAGLLYVLLVAAFRVPAWFAGLAIGVVVVAALPVTYRLADPGDVVTLPGPPNGLYLLGGAAVLAVAGGFIGLAPGVRDGFSAVKRLADGEGERSASAVFLLLGGTVLSMLLAAASGYVSYMYALGPIEGQHTLNFGPYADLAVAVEPQLLAFAIALLAGTSLWGRRGGVFGGVLTAVAVWAGLVLWGRAVADAGEGSWQADYSQAIYAGILLVALFVSFALDRLGRPKETIEPDDGIYTQEMRPFEPTTGTPDGTGLFDPTLPDATAPQR